MAPYNRMPKRGHKTLSIKEKCAIIDKLANGVSGKQLALEYSVGTSTISDIKKQKEKIQKFVKETEIVPEKRKNLRLGEFPDMEELLKCWFLEQRRKNLPISKSLLCEKARQLFKNLYDTDIGFTASNGWYDKFRSRYGIRYLTLSGEKLSCDAESVEPFKKKLRDIIKTKGLTKNQIYNADESALFWKMLPDKTLAHVSERSAPGRKMSKERITFLSCANASGEHRLKLLIIGKSKKPRSFKNAELPVEYRHSKNAWMTAGLFRDWFRNCFIPQVKSYLERNNLPLKALLLVDNAACHVGPTDDFISNDENMEILYFPPNCTALIQPMDQNPIRLCKLHYKKSLISHIISSTDKENLVDVLKKINLKDAAMYLATAWDSVKQEYLVKSWKSLLQINSENDAEDWSSEDELPLIHFHNQRDDLLYIQGLLQEVSVNNINNEDVNEWIDETIDYDIGEEEYVESEEENYIDSTCDKISHEVALESFNTCIKWAEQNNTTFQQITTLLQLRQKSLQLKQQKKYKQAKVTDYF